jgi:hypothetical protein
MNLDKIKEDGLYKTKLYVKKSDIPRRYYRKLEKSIILTDDLIFEYVKNNTSVKVSFKPTNNILFKKEIELTDNELIGIKYQLPHVKELTNKFTIYYVNEDGYDYNTVFILSSSLLFKNSRKFLDIIAKNILFYGQHVKEMEILKFMSNYLLKNFHPLDICMFNIVSSVVLFLYGCRKFNDIDCDITYHKDVPTMTTNFIPKVNKLKQMLNNKYNIKFDTWIDYDFKYTNDIKWESDVIMKRYNICTNAEILLNPKFNFYFLGLKINEINFEIFRRFNSLRYTCQHSRMADLIYLNKKFDMVIKISYNDDLYNGVTECVDTIIEKYKNNYNETINKEEIIKLIKKTYNDKYFVKIRDI